MLEEQDNLDYAQQMFQVRLMILMFFLEEEEAIANSLLGQNGEYIWRNQFLEASKISHKTLTCEQVFKHPCSSTQLHIVRPRNDTAAPLKEHKTDKLLLSLSRCEPRSMIQRQNLELDGKGEESTKISHKTTIESTYLSSPLSSDSLESHMVIVKQMSHRPFSTSFKGLCYSKEGVQNSTLQISWHIVV